MGFLGKKDFNKEGKGVKKDEIQKNRFFTFFDLLFRKFWKLIQLNMLYLLFCIPIVTIGPATVALAKITRYYVEEKPVFMLSDFWDAFKSNFKQGLIIGLIDLVVFLACGTGIKFYYDKMYDGTAYIILLGLICFVTLVIVLANFYTFILISTVDLPIMGIIRNSISFSVVGLKSNFFTVVFAGGILAASILLIPYSLIVLVFLTFSLCSLIISFNSFQYIYKYSIKPYYEANNLENPYETKEPEKDEQIFEDTL